MPLDCELDHTFPRYNPNTEDMKMLHAMRDAVLLNKADVGSASTATATAAAWSTTRARRFSPTRSASCWRAICRRLHKNSTFVVDVKSTGLFLTDPVLKANGVKVDYWKTGHSYIKRRVNELGARGGLREVRALLLQQAVRPRL